MPAEWVKPARTRACCQVDFLAAAAACRRCQRAAMPEGARAPVPPTALRCSSTRLASRVMVTTPPLTQTDHQRVGEWVGGWVGATRQRCQAGRGVRRAPRAAARSLTRRVEGVFLRQPTPQLAELGVGQRSLALGLVCGGGEGRQLRGRRQPQALAPPGRLPPPAAAAGGAGGAPLRCARPSPLPHPSAQARPSPPRSAPRWRSQCPRSRRTPPTLATPGAAWRGRPPCRRAGASALAHALPPAACVCSDRGGRVSSQLARRERRAAEAQARHLAPRGPPILTCLGSSPWPLPLALARTRSLLDVLTEALQVPGTPNLPRRQKQHARRRPSPRRAGAGALRQHPGAEPALVSGRVCDGAAGTAPRRGCGAVAGRR